MTGVLVPGAMAGEWDVDPFETLTSEARLAILRALAEHQAADPTDPALSFADLRRAAAIEDSGNFNYHLDRLRPEFVRRTEAGYLLTPAGVELVGTVRAGVAPRESRGPHELDEDCKLCGDPLFARYEDGQLSVACDDGHVQPALTLPPSAVVDRGLAAAVELLVVRNVQQGELVRRSVCPVCYGGMDLEHVLAEDAPDPARHVFQGTCGNCGMVYTAPTGTFFLRHPAVVDFCRDHGVAVGDGGYWDLSLPVDGGRPVGRDPLRIEVDETLDDERLTLVVSADLAVVESRREPV